MKYAYAKMASKLIFKYDFQISTFKVLKCKMKQLKQLFVSISRYLWKKT